MNSRQQAVRETLDAAWSRVYVRAGELIWKRTDLIPTDAHGIAAEVYNLIAVAADEVAGITDGDVDRRRK